jgi:transposase
MSYLGLVPSEYSSGETRRQGAITKSGSRHARRLLVEAAWHYRRPPRLGTTLERRQNGQDQAVLAWNAQQHLHRIWRRLELQRGKRRTIIAVAVARQLAGFCWAIVNHTPSVVSSAGIHSGGRPPHANSPQPPKRTEHQPA